MTCHITTKPTHTHAPRQLTRINVLQREGGADHGGQESALAHLEIYGAGRVSFAAPLGVGGHDELINERADCLAIDAVRVFVIRAVEARVPGQVVT
jgi:hypothetical protein